MYNDRLGDMLSKNVSFKCNGGPASLLFLFSSAYMYVDSLWEQYVESSVGGGKYFTHKIKKRDVYYIECSVLT